MKRILNWLFPKQPKMTIEMSTTQKHQFLSMKVKTLFKHDDRLTDASILVCSLSCEGIEYVYRLNKQGLDYSGLDGWWCALKDTVAMGEKLPASCK